MKSLRLLSILALLSLAIAAQVAINFGYAPQKDFKKKHVKNDDVFFQIDQPNVQQIETLEQGQLVASVTFQDYSSTLTLPVIVSTLDTQTTVPIADFDKKFIYQQGEVVKITVSFGKYVAIDTSVLLDGGKYKYNSGVLGLGVNSGFIDALKQSKVISKKMFAFYLSNTINFATFGNFEKYLTNDDINYYNVQGTDGLWRVAAADVSIVITGVASSTGLKSENAVFDSTIQGLRAPASFWNNDKITTTLKATVSGSSVEFNCNGDLSSLPTLQFTFGSNTYTLEPAGYAKLQSGKKTCQTLDDSAISYDINLGRSFMTKYYTIFDLDNKKIGLATATTDTFESYLIDTKTQKYVVQYGIILIIVSFFLLMCIMKPLTKRQSLSEKPNQNVEDNKKVVPVQQSLNQQLPNLQQSINRNVSPLRQQVERSIQQSQWAPQLSQQPLFQLQPQAQDFQQSLDQSLNRTPIRNLQQ